MIFLSTCFQSNTLQIANEYANLELSKQRWRPDRFQVKLNFSFLAYKLSAHIPACGVVNLNIAI